MSTPSVPNLGDLLLVGPRLYERSLSQLALVRSLLGYLPCVSRDDGAGEPEEQPDAPVTDERVDVLSVLSEEPPVADLPPSVRSRGAAADVGTAHAAADAGSAGLVAVPLESELAIPEYDSLAASQVVPKLATLNQDELGAVGDYERAHRARRTILNRVSQLQKA